ncbi:MAG: hypothetical protein ACYCY3_00175 [Halothiobacillus sp.]
MLLALLVTQALALALAVLSVVDAGYVTPYPITLIEADLGYGLLMMAAAGAILLAALPCGSGLTGMIYRPLRRQFAPVLIEK